MECPKIMKFLDNTPNQPNEFRTKNQVEINDDARGTYNKNNQIKFETSILKSSLCDYSDTYIFPNRTIEIPNTGAAVATNYRKKIIKNYSPFTDCISEINNTQIDDAKDIDVVMPMNNVIEYSDYFYQQLFKNNKKFMAIVQR